MQILLEPSSLTALLVRKWPSNDSAAARSLWEGGLRIIAATAAVVLLAPIGASLVAGNGTAWHVLIGAAMGAVAAAESVARYARVVWQVRQQFRAMAAVDLAIMTGRLLTVGGLLVAAPVKGFAAASLAAAVLLPVTVLIAAGRAVGENRADPIVASRLAREAMPYWAGTALSSVYSQGPVVLIGLVGSLHSAAIYTVASRITQPTELVPAAIASVGLPRMVQTQDPRALAREFVAQCRFAAGLGALAVTTLIAVLSPWILQLFALSFAEAGGVLLLLAAVLPFKFASFQYVSLAVATGRITTRVKVAGVIAAASLAGVLLTASEGPAAVAAVTLALGGHSPRSPRAANPTAEGAHGATRVSQSKRVLICSSAILTSGEGVVLDPRRRSTERATRGGPFESTCRSKRCPRHSSQWLFRSRADPGAGADEACATPRERDL